MLGEEQRGKPRPPVKWAGGKARLLPQLRPLFPHHFVQYVEPFLGGGAVFFDLVPSRAVLIDSNPDLIDLYVVIRDRLEDLLAELLKHKNTPEHFYWVRSQDPCETDVVARAARFLYLNKTAYNGLWRVNSKGKFNVPFGRYKNPKIADSSNLAKVRDSLRGAEIICADFTQVLEHATPETFVYFDPPYHPISGTANFTSYTRTSFREDDQQRLADVFRQLNNLGCFVMLSNSDTDFVRELYAGFDTRVIYARRAINCKPDGRGPVPELVVRNYV